MDARAERAMHALVGDFVARYPDEAAEAIEHLPIAAIAQNLAAQPSARAAAVVDRLTPATGSKVLLQLPPARAGRVLAALDPGRAVSLLSWVEPGRREGLLALLGPDDARELRELAEYPPDSAGRLMDPRAVSVHAGATVREALTRIRSRRRRTGEIFVVDPDGRLLGAVPLQDAALSAPAGRIGALVRRAPPAVAAMATREEVIEQLAGRDVTSVAVVDLDGRLLGVIRPETLVSVAQEDAGADMLAMVGASREERGLSPVSFVVRKRLLWLHVNLVTAFVAAAVVGLFDETIAQFTALAVLLPVVAGQSGNTGAQALAVTMRGLVLRDVRVRNWFAVASKEARAALINGFVLALTTAAAVYVWSGSSGLSLIIALALVTSMFAAALAGALIPMVLTTLKQDPAQSSSIILTTVTDVVGFFSFLGIATILADMI